MNYIKKYISQIFQISLFVFSMTSCVKDESTLNDLSINALEVNTDGGQTFFEVVQIADTLRIEPEVNYSGSGELSYLWKIYLTSNSTIVDTIGTDRILETSINQNPSQQSNPYIVELEVTEKNTGLRAFGRYVLQVNAVGAVPPGWLLLHENGQGTDLSLIRTQYLTSSLAQSTVYRDIYSAANGEIIPGKPVSTANIFTGQLILTESTGVSVNASDFKKLYDLKDLFFRGAPSIIKPQGILSYSNLVNNDAIYLFNQGFYFGALASDPLGYQPFPQEFSNNAFYDVRNKRFLSIGSEGSTVAYSQSSPGSAFNLNNIGKDIVYIAKGYGGADPWGFGFVTENNTYAIFKDSDNKCWLYGIAFYDPENPDVCRIDISHFTEILQSQFFDFGTLAPIGFYATKQRIYSYTYSADANSVGKSFIAFDVPDGEEITAMKLFKDDGFGFFMPGHEQTNRVLYLATWSETKQSATVYLLEVNPLQGTINSKPLQVFSGFGKIKEMAYKSY